MFFGSRSNAQDKPRDKQPETKANREHHDEGPQVMSWGWPLNGRKH